MGVVNYSADSGQAPWNQGRPPFGKLRAGSSTGSGRTEAVPTRGF